MAKIPVQAREFMDRFGLRHPIVLAPMMGASTSELVAAVQRTGGLAFYGGGTVRREDGLANAVAETWHALDRSRRFAGFGADLMVPSGFFRDRRSWTPEQRLASREAERRHEFILKELDRRASAARLGLRADSLVDCLSASVGVNRNSNAELRADSEDPVQDLTTGKGHQAELAQLNGTFEDQIDLLIEQRVPVVSFHFGWPEAHQVAKLKSEGVFLIGKATSVREARLLAECGADCVVAQGSEAGAHTGKFLDDAPTPPTLQLTSELVAALPGIPIIAAGGLMDGGDIAEALKAGASAAMLGTAFLTTHECNTAKVHREALLFSASAGADTRLTRVFTGKPARTLVISRYTTQVMGDLEPRLPNCFNGMPLGRVLQKAAASAAEPDLMYMWAGANWARCRRRGTTGLSAADLVRQLEEELADYFRGVDPAVEESKAQSVQQCEILQRLDASL